MPLTLLRFGPEKPRYTRRSKQARLESALDVHPPQSPIHSVKEFLLHLLAITIGLLIALGLESSVEWVHHRHLVRDARENIFQEMRDNRQSVLTHLNAIPGEISHLNELLAVVDSPKNGRPGVESEEFQWTTPLLSDSSWTAASSTGATSFMNYAEVKRYSQVYAVQNLYSSTMNRNIEGRREMFVFLTRIRAEEKLPDNEVESCKRTIVSEILTLNMLRELDNGLSERYSRILNQSK